jgi:glutaredoxin 3
METAVLIYTTETCPYCDRAKQLLSAKGVRYEEIRIDTDPARKAEMIEKSGRRSVPQIFIHGQSIGGFDDMALLEKTGQLDSLLHHTS